MAIFCFLYRQLTLSTSLRYNSARVLIKRPQGSRHGPSKALSKHPPHFFEDAFFEADDDFSAFENLTKVSLCLDCRWRLKNRLKSRNAFPAERDSTSADPRMSKSAKICFMEGSKKWLFAEIKTTVKR